MFFCQSKGRKNWGLLLCVTFMGMLVFVGNALARHKYKVYIHTTDQFEAGTDSNIFLKMYGHNGVSLEHRLNGYIKGNAFERGDTNKLTLSEKTNIGPIYEISVRSDTLHPGSNWRCSYIHIKDETAGKEYKFSVGKWFKSKHHKYFYEARFAPTKVGRGERRTVPVVKVVVKNNESDEVYKQAYTIDREEIVYCSQEKHSSHSTEVEAGASWESPKFSFGKFTASVNTKFNSVIADDFKRAKTIKTSISDKGTFDVKPWESVIRIYHWSTEYTDQTLTDGLGFTQDMGFLTSGPELELVDIIAFSDAIKAKKGVYSKKDWFIHAQYLYDGLQAERYRNLVLYLQNKGWLAADVPHTKPPSECTD